MSKTGTTATFKYNSEGMRVQKTVNSTVTNYTLHGKNIVHLTQGSNTLHFWYDAQNRPAIVEWNNGTTAAKYGYIYNLQGDIVGIIDSSGNEVVKYTYDAWGKVLSTTGSLASTLGTVQPFRYRGYVYDAETGLYYLRSRYYYPILQRFINSDLLFKGNLFSYCKNQPIYLIDSNGKSPINKQNISTVAQLFLVIKGWYRTNDLFQHALWGYGSEYVSKKTDPLSKDIATNPESRDFFRHLADNMENNTQKHISSTELGALEFKEGDLHYALQHVSYSGELFKDENGKISAK